MGEPNWKQRSEKRPVEVEELTGDDNQANQQKWKENNYLEIIPYKANKNPLNMENVSLSQENKREMAKKKGKAKIVALTQWNNKDKVFIPIKSKGIKIIEPVKPIKMVLIGDEPNKIVAG